MYAYPHRLPPIALFSTGCVRQTNKNMYIFVGITYEDSFTSNCIVRSRVKRLSAYGIRLIHEREDEWERGLTLKPQKNKKRIVASE